MEVLSMIKRWIKRIITTIFILFTVFIISVISLILYVIYSPPAPITVNLRREHDTSWVDIASVDSEVYRQLQHHGKSYYVTKDYIYTYGSTGFVYIERKNAKVYVVLMEDMNDDDRSFITNYLTIRKKNLKYYFPEIKFIRKEDLDPEKYQIMTKLENEERPYPHYQPIEIYPEDNK